MDPDRSGFEHPSLNHQLKHLVELVPWHGIRSQRDKRSWVQISITCSFKVELASGMRRVYAASTLLAQNGSHVRRRVRVHNISWGLNNRSWFLDIDVFRWNFLNIFRVIVFTYFACQVVAIERLLFTYSYCRYFFHFRIRDQTKCCGGYSKSYSQIFVIAWVMSTTMTSWRVLSPDFSRYHLLGWVTNPSLIVQNDSSAKAQTCTLPCSTPPMLEYLTERIMKVHLYARVEESLPSLCFVVLICRCDCNYCILRLQVALQ